MIRQKTMIDGLVSVAIPAYNQGRFIKAAIDSVLKQTYENWELIICDNASTDNTELICRKYIDKRIKYHRWSENIGSTANFNKCVELARGEYVKILCSDDTIHPKCLEKSVEALKDAALVSTRRAITDDKLTQFDSWGYANTDLLIDGQKAIDYCVRATNQIGEPGCVTFRAKYAGFFDEKWGALADLDFWLQVLKHGKYAYLNEHLFNFRRHEATDTLKQLSDPDYRKKEEHIMVGMRKKYSTKIKTTYFLRDDGGCGYYRVELPMKSLATYGDNEVAEFKVGDSLDDLEKSLYGADSVLIPRLSEDKFIELSTELQKLGKKIIVDQDDNVFHVSPFSPHYETAGIEDVKYRMPGGQTIDLWLDGKNKFDIERNKRQHEAFKRALGLCDMLTVTTPQLAEAYKPYCKNIVVLPNCVDLNLWKKLPLKRHDGIRMGWFGGYSHYEDWLLLVDVLPDMMKKYPELKLVLMGTVFKGTLKNIDWDRIETHQWVPTSAYPYKAAILDLDFAIIPLERNTFNQCKSNIKWVEMGALCVPAVTSYETPYKEYATDNNGIFIEDNDVKAWKEGISAMVEDEKLREVMGFESHKTVREHFDISKKYKLWEDAYKNLLDMKVSA